MINFSYTIWIPLIPFMMFLLLGLAGHKLKAKLSGLLGTGGTGSNYNTVIYYSLQVLFHSEKVEEGIPEDYGFQYYMASI